MSEELLKAGKPKFPTPPSLSHLDFGFTDDDLEKEVFINDGRCEGLTNSAKSTWKLKDLIAHLQEIYCNKIGYQYMHISNKAERDWIRLRIENAEKFKPTKEQLIRTADRLCRDYAFTEFLNNTFSTTKRFGSEGCDSFISGLGALIDYAAEKKVEHVILGMPHRGRINTLYAVMKKPVDNILAEFQDINIATYDDENWGNSGDVKYHLGTTHDKKYGDHTIRLSILANPSHLEAVNPVVHGKLRCIQDAIQDNKGERSFGIVIHGDASFSGQGIVYESLQMHDLKDYNNGGTIHLVVNNQIGFTTYPGNSRTTLYCTDIAETVGAPVFHVNADEPELVDAIMRLALDYRQAFHKDVVIDIIGYRKFGHNELDQPAYTQPQMQKIIQGMRPVYLKYMDKMYQQKIIPPEVEKERRAYYDKSLHDAYINSRQSIISKNEWVSKPWEEVRLPTKFGQVEDTGVDAKTLKEISAKINELPSDLNVHKQIQKVYQQRREAIEQTESKIDFGTAEALAFGSLLLEGYGNYLILMHMFKKFYNKGIRISGQDVERGTFSHRHAKVNDQRLDREKYIPLQQLLSVEDIAKKRLTITNSHLSEYGVLGFEYGYSIANPNNLVIWEAQFGDFSNGAQIMIDNFIVSGETKWKQQSGLVVNLPHGLDGQGPEHSSGRIERVLQLSDDDPRYFNRATGTLTNAAFESNLQVIVPTTSANYFHALRRQLRRSFRKPLFSFNSKRLLRYARVKIDFSNEYFSQFLQKATSELKEFDSNTSFRDIIPETFPQTVDEPSKIKKVVVCSGQVYYDILERRESLKAKDTVILRLEQISPFPYDNLKSELAAYKNAKFVWVQEEHENQGGWYFVKPRIQAVLSKLKNEGAVNNTQLFYIGRHASCSPAAGQSNRNKQELNLFLTNLFEKL